MPRRFSVALAAIALASGSLLAGGSLLTGSAAGDAAGPAPAVSLDPGTGQAAECLAASHNRVRFGYQGVDPNSLTSKASRSAEHAAQQKLDKARSRISAKAAPLVTIDVRVHVITKRNGKGAVSKKRIKKQIAVLNNAYAGKTSTQSAPTIFKFRLRSLDVTKNNDWYKWSDPEFDPSDNDEAKAKLHKGGYDDLNVYVTGLSDGLLGYATFPWEANLRNDGVVVLNASLPGGSATGFNKGDSLTHEVGHWLGLLHTFEGGCTAPGDQVDDTPYQADGENVFSCDTNLDTCTQPGLDPVHNFMSYGDDPCLNRFTAGQATRMMLSWFTFRQPGVLLP